MAATLRAVSRRDLKHHVFFAVSPLDRTFRVEKALKSHKRDFCAGRILMLEGGSAPATYCVLDGWLALSKSTSDGQRQIIDFALAGDIVNPTSADKYTSTVQIEALCDTKVSVVPNDIWADLLDDVPFLAAMQNQVNSSALSRMSERMLRLGKGTAEMRIAFSLIELYLRLQVIGRVDFDRFHIPLTQQQLGEFAGLSSVHVCRTMRRLSHRKLLTVDGQMGVVIHDLQGLAEAAGVDLDMLKAEIIPAGYSASR